MLRLTCFLLALTTAAPAAARIKVAATIEDLAALVRAVGGDDVEVTALARGYTDPHYLQAKPSYMVRLRDADLLVHVGLQLEVGWLPLLVEGARNPRIRPGRPGVLAASAGLDILEIPRGEVSRAAGDIHPEGNPHVWLDPRNGVVMARTIARRLAELDPEHAAGYQARAQSFAAGLTTRIAAWEKRLAPFRGRAILAYHKQWEYLARWLGLEIAGYVEDRPGIPPTARHLVEVVRIVQARHLPALVAASFIDPKVPEFVSRKAGIPTVFLPPSVGAEPGVADYPTLFETIVKRLEKALGGPP